jgi:hypothetical protein
MDYYQPPAAYQVAQLEAILRDAQKVDISKFAPPTALSLKIRITITPPSGVIVIYTPSKPGEPIRFNGPVAEGDVPLSGSFIYVQPVQGTATWNIEALGWRDNVNAN